MDKMSGSELYDYIIRTFKRTDKSAEVYDAITDTLMDMCEEFGFEENKVEAYTTAGISALGDYKIDLPDDFGHLIGDVRWTDQDDSYTLTKLSKQQFNEMFPEQDCDDPDDGEPTHYCVFGKQILLGPVPDRTTYEYQIDYAKFLADPVTSASSDVMFTDNARECVKFGSLARLYEVIEEWDNAARYSQKYDLELAEFVAREKKNTRAIFAMKEMK
ncbi:MAG: hypothetical protein E6Q97_27115 [Desulfurellales bacterium]|nr:MAG: hypothetical protein E6Q97_27115 [Desulfurellales bacterium]